MPTLMEQWREAVRAVDLSRAVQHQIEAQIAEADGDPWRAEWHRLEAAKLRHPSPEAAERSHRAWLVAMARSHLRSGTTPSGYEADAIALTMDELRAEAIHAA